MRVSENTQCWIAWFPRIERCRKPAVLFVSRLSPRSTALEVALSASRCIEGATCPWHSLGAGLNSALSVAPPTKVLQVIRPFGGCAISLLEVASKVVATRWGSPEIHRR